MATLDYGTVKIVGRETSSIQPKRFLTFLGKVILAYPIGKIVLILDNACIHHVKILKPFLKELKILVKPAPFIATSLQP